MAAVDTYLRRQRGADRRYFRQSRRALEAWYQNPYLKELLQPAYQSRAVVAETEAITRGAGEAARIAAERAARAGLGAGYRGQQQLEIDLAKSGAIAASRGSQEIRRLGVGAEREQIYRQGQADLAAARHGARSSRYATRYAAAAADEASQSGILGGVLSAGGALAGAAAGSAIPGIGTVFGSQAGATLGGMLGAAAGGAPNFQGGGLPALLLARQQIQQPIPAVGFNPAYTYMMSPNFPWWQYLGQAGTTAQSRTAGT